MAFVYICPDGSPGAKGKNDWKDNVAILKLQQGHWYPSAMNMVNGSILVIGGFGLATDPNLNALLYNPMKPLRERITAMANTTVARMYLSEAITLLVGHVLVSGSDPEDSVNPQEHRIETFTPPYLLRVLPRPTFSMTNRDWAFG
ncbi:Fc.00g062550.m01.CDS01 [Cosmosporella sp. VM-42]